MIDPAARIGWINNREFRSLAVTLGYTLDGRPQIAIKPSAGSGPERPFDWGMQRSVQRLRF